MVAGDRPVLVAAQELYTLRRAGSVTHQIAKRPYLVESNSLLGVIDDALERFEVTVDVAYDKSAQLGLACERVGTDTIIGIPRNSF